MIYKWDKNLGLVDQDGRQIMQCMPVNCSHKFRNTAGKLMVEKLNSIERAKSVKA